MPPDWYEHQRRREAIGDALAGVILLALLWGMHFAGCF